MLGDEKAKYLSIFRNIITMASKEITLLNSTVLQKFKSQ